MYERLSEMCIVQHVETKNVFTFQPIKGLVSTTVKSAKLAAAIWIFLLRTNNRQLCCLAVTVYIASQERWVVTTKKKRHLHFEEIFPPITTKHTWTWTKKRLKWVQIRKTRILFLLVDDLMSHLFNFQIFLFNFNLQSTSQIKANLHKIIMISSVSNHRIQWIFDFGPDSVTISVNDLDQNVTISSQEIPPAAWHLLLSPGQDLLDNHLPRVPITQNEEGTMETRDEVLSSVGALDFFQSKF